MPWVRSANASVYCQAPVMSAVFGWMPPRPKQAAKAASTAGAGTRRKRGIRPMLNRMAGAAAVKSRPGQHLLGHRDQLVARKPRALHAGGPANGPEKGGHSDKHVPLANEQILPVLPVREGLVAQAGHRLLVQQSDRPYLRRLELLHGVRRPRDHDDDQERVSGQR